MNAAPIKVLIIDDHAALVGMMTQVVELVPGFQVVGCALDAEAALAAEEGHLEKAKLDLQLAERRGIAIVTDGKGAVSGVITTGDLSRLMEHEDDVFPIPVTKVMNRTPKVARADELGSAVVYRMETHGIIAINADQ